jgi:integrase
MATESIAVAPHESSRSEVGADGGSRTLTAFRPQDFKFSVAVFCLPYMLLSMPFAATLSRVNEAVHVPWSIHGQQRTDAWETNSLLSPTSASSTSSLMGPLRTLPSGGCGIGVWRQAPGKSAVYAQFRYKLHNSWRSVELGRLPTEDEMEAMSSARLDTLGPNEHGFASTSFQLDYAIEPFRKRARGYQRKLHAGLDPKGEQGVEGFTLRQAMARHAQRMRNKGKAESSIAEYIWHAERGLGDWLEVPLRKLTPSMVRERHEAIGKKRGHYAANKTMRYFRAFWNTARKEDTSLPASPTIAVEMYKETRRDAAIPLRQLPKWFTEVNRLKNPVIRDLLLLTVLTGLRKATVCAIRREHINLQKGTLFIPKPKGGADRAYTILLSDAAMVIVERRLAATNSEWLFPGSGKSGHIHDPRSDKLKVEFTIHGLRNTYISAASTAGVSPYHSKLLSNHALPKNEVHAGYVSKDVDALRSSQQRITDFLREHGLPV